MMNKFFQRLLLFEKFEVKTKLKKQEVLQKVSSFADPAYTDYYGMVSENGFFLAEKNVKYSGGHTQNPFAPIARAKIDENEGITSVSVVLRMNILTLIVFVPIYLLSLLLIVTFPIMLLILHFTFVKPARKLKETLENLLQEKE